MIKNSLRKKPTAETNRLAKHAVQKPDTSKPRTSDDTSEIISALITSRNAPSVSRVNGIVNQKMMGLTIAFANPSSKAEKIKDGAPENLMPRNK